MTLTPRAAAHSQTVYNVANGIPTPLKDSIITQINSAISSGQFLIYPIIGSSDKIYGYSIVYWLKDSGYTALYQDWTDDQGRLTITW